MSDNLRNMADHLEKRHREYHSAPVLEMAVIAMRNGADRIEELEVENARLQEALVWASAVVYRVADEEEVDPNTLAVAITKLDTLQEGE